MATVEKYIEWSQSVPEHIQQFLDGIYPDISTKVAKGYTCGVSFGGKRYSCDALGWTVERRKINPEWRIGFNYAGIVGEDVLPLSLVVVKIPNSMVRCSAKINNTVGKILKNIHRASKIKTDFQYLGDLGEFKFGQDNLNFEILPDWSWRPVTTSKP
jgi:hypothetical protein